MVEDWLVFLLTSLSGIALIIIMLVTCVDVIGRWLFNSPLTGSTELTELGLAFVVFSSLPFICWREKNIVVDVFDNLFTSRVRKIRSIIIQIISAVCLAYIGQRLFVLAERSLLNGEETEYLAIPLGWTILFMAFICWLSVFCSLTFGIAHSCRKHSEN